MSEVRLMNRVLGGFRDVWGRDSVGMIGLWVNRVFIRYFGVVV